MIAAVELVTPEHGDRFAAEWEEQSIGSMVMGDAFAASGVMTWPEYDRAVQGDFLDIEDEIVVRIAQAVRPAIAAAFVAAANDVLSRERRRRHPAISTGDES